MVTKNIELQKKEALKTSIHEGSFNAVSTGVTNPYITPFALKLGAKEDAIGLLSGLSGIISPIAQLIGSSLMNKFHRKNIVIYSVLIQSIIWLPMAIIAILVHLNKNIPNPFLLFSIFYYLAVILGGIAHPAWFSWMGDITNPAHRGKYFANRNRILGTVELISIILSGILLRYLENKNLALIGFAILFTISFFGRLLSFFLLAKQYIPHPRPKEKYSLDFRDFFSNNHNFRRFAKYQLYFNLAIMIASPFFAVYMLNVLKFNYLTYILVTISSSIFILLFTPLMGKFSDRYGNTKLLMLSNFCFVLSPILWIINTNPIYLVIFPQVISGLANSSLAIAYNNFTYSSVKEEQIGLGVSYVNMLVGIGTLIGSLIGGYLLTNLTITFVNKFVFVFLLASLLRLIVALIFLPKLKEDMQVKSLPHVHISLSHPFRSISSEIAWIRHIFK